MPQSTDLVKAATTQATVKFYDADGRHLVDVAVSLVHVPEVISIEPEYLILDQRQTFTLTAGKQRDDESDAAGRAFFELYEVHAMFPDENAFPIDGEKL